MIEERFRIIKSKIDRMEVPILELMTENSFLTYLDWEQAFVDEMKRQKSLDSADGIVLL